MEETWELAALMTDTVYILTNPSMPDLVKIGKTSGPITDRMRQLYQTGVPLPFECFYAAEVESYDRVEKALHLAFGDHRENPRREFFRISPDKPKAIIELLALKDVTPRDEVVDSPEEQRAINKAKSIRSRFKFELAKIEIGSLLHSVFGDQYTCEVISNTKVKFRDEDTSLSRSALDIAHEEGFTWNAISGPEYWKYDGETLDERRQRLEAENSDE